MFQKPFDVFTLIVNGVRVIDEKHAHHHLHGAEKSCVSADDSQRHDSVEYLETGERLASVEFPGKFLNFIQTSHKSAKRKHQNKMTFHETLRKESERNPSQDKFSWINDAIRQMTSCHGEAGTSSFFQGQNHNAKPGFFRVSNSELSEVTLPPSLRHIQSESNITVKLNKLSSKARAKVVEDGQSNVLHSGQSVLIKYLQSLMSQKQEENEKVSPAIEHVSTDSYNESISNSDSETSTHAIEHHVLQVLDNSRLALKHVESLELASHMPKIEFDRSRYQNQKPPKEVEVTADMRKNCSSEGQAAKHEPSDIDDEKRTTESDDITTEYLNLKDVEVHEIRDAAYSVTSLTADEDVTTALSHVEHQDSATGRCEIFDSEFQSDLGERKRRGILTLQFLFSCLQSRKKNLSEGSNGTDDRSAIDNPDDAPIEELRSRHWKIRSRPRKVLSFVLKGLRKSKPAHEPSNETEWEIISWTTSLNILDI